VTGQNIDQILEERGTITSFRPAPALLGPDIPHISRDLPLVDAAEFDGKPVPPRIFHAEGLIPARTVTLLYGDGGTGKSLIALQLAAATVLARPWLGLNVASGKCLFLTAEDELDEVHRRLSDVAASSMVPLAALKGLHILSLAGEDAILGELDARRGAITPSTLFARLQASTAAYGFKLVIIDTLADVFGGDENNRSQARQFIGQLRGLALQCDTTILVLAHPSVAGMNGRGASGSTGWSNSVRSRLYFERVKNSNGEEDDPNARALKTLKANYGPTGGEIQVRWHAGIFELCAAKTDSFAVLASQSKADRTFLELLQAYQCEGRTVSPSTGRNYAPDLFFRDARRGDITKASLTDAMNRLYASGSIKTEEVGSASRLRKQIIIARDA